MSKFTNALTKDNEFKRPEIRLKKNDSGSGKNSIDLTDKNIEDVDIDIDG